MSRKPSNPGEELIATLPNMQIQLDTHVFDFLWKGRQRFEVEYRSKPHPVGRSTLQFQWPDVDKGQYDWLILTGMYLDQWRLWILPAAEARERFMTPTNGGQITYVVNGIRPSRQKAKEFALHEMTYECLKEALA